jgi:hypothetical protein
VLRRDGLRPAIVMTATTKTGDLGGAETAVRAALRDRCPQARPSCSSRRAPAELRTLGGRGLVGSEQRGLELTVAVLGGAPSRASRRTRPRTCEGPYPGTIVLLLFR